MNRRQALHCIAAAAAAATLPAVASPALPTVAVAKVASCDCCTGWVDHMKAAGFPVTVRTVDDTTAVRKRLGIPDRYGSCHTAAVGGYALEGHVPADEVKRLLATKPKAIGLAVPSMPPGSPGMEVGDRHDPFDVFLIDRSGHASVFARYPKTTA